MTDIKNSQPDLTMDKKIGNYAIGQGTFGKVKQGIHITTGEKVAIKVLEKEKILEQSDVERVEREISILKKLRHPYIIQLYEIIETSKKLYLIMEYASGGELFEYIVTNNRLSEVESCKFFQQILSGVEYLAKMGVAHRDLKPENLLLDEKNNLKIVDFGLSNCYLEKETLKTACGSPCYAAPEMILGKVFTQQVIFEGQKYDGLLVDLWSTGIIMYALICGYLPFEDPNTAILYRKIIQGDFHMPRFLSPQAKDLLIKILNVNPRQRYKINDIKNHDWYQLYDQNLLEKGLFNGDEQIMVEENVLKDLKNLGLSPEEVQQNILDNKHNQSTTTYLLLLKKIMRQNKPLNYVPIKSKQHPKKLNIDIQSFITTQIPTQNSPKTPNIIKNLTKQPSKNTKVQTILKELCSPEKQNSQKRYFQGPKSSAEILNSPNNAQNRKLNLRYLLENQQKTTQNVISNTINVKINYSHICQSTQNNTKNDQNEKYFPAFKKQSHQTSQSNERITQEYSIQQQNQSRQNNHNFKLKGLPNSYFLDMKNSTNDIKNQIQTQTESVEIQSPKQVQKYKKIQSANTHHVSNSAKNFNPVLKASLYDFFLNHNNFDVKKAEIKDQQVKIDSNQLMNTKKEAKSPLNHKSIQVNRKLWNNMRQKHSIQQNLFTELNNKINLASPLPAPATQSKKSHSSSQSQQFNSTQSFLKKHQHKVSEIIHTVPNENKKKPKFSEIYDTNIHLDDIDIQKSATQRVSIDKNNSLTAQFGQQLIKKQNLLKRQKLNIKVLEQLKTKTDTKIVQNNHVNLRCVTKKKVEEIIENLEKILNEKLIQFEKSIKSVYKCQYLDLQFQIEICKLLYSDNLQMVKFEVNQGDFSSFNKLIYEISNQLKL